MCERRALRGMHEGNCRRGAVKHPQGWAKVPLFIPSNRCGSAILGAMCGGGWGGISTLKAGAHMHRDASSYPLLRCGRSSGTSWGRSGTQWRISGSSSTPSFAPPSRWRTLSASSIHNPERRIHACRGGDWDHLVPAPVWQHTTHEECRCPLLHSECPSEGGWQWGPRRAPDTPLFFASI